MEQVVVLMSTYNGGRYLREQLDSVLNQTSVQVRLLVRDDGSVDDTVAILQEYQNKGLLKWYAGENLKPARSFMDLVYQAPEAEWYAFCDQDDIWLNDKLAIAIQDLKEKGYSESQPCLYYGKPRVVNQDMEVIDNELWDDVRDDYSKSLIENKCTGCTMVFNQTLMKLVQKKNPHFIVMHDEWIHKLCITVGGVTCWDTDVHMLYRRHDSTVTDVDKTTVLQKICAHFRSFQKKPCPRSKVIKSLYDCYRDAMTEENLELTKMVVDYRRSIRDTLRLAFCSQMSNEKWKELWKFRVAVILRMY